MSWEGLFCCFYIHNIFLSDIFAANKQQKRVKRNEM